MHELYMLEQAALEAYSIYSFPRGWFEYFIAALHPDVPVLVIHALNNFVNNNLSSFYFDITKDCLYADSVNSHERRAVVTVLEQVDFDCHFARRISLTNAAPDSWNADQSHVPCSSLSGGGDTRGLEG